MDLRSRIVFPSRRTRSVAQFVGDNKTRICYAQNLQNVICHDKF